eukprot:scaffold4418_cov149-Isochrysis_galbana.AAC.2
MFVARSSFARQLRTSVSYIPRPSKQSGMPFFANAKQAAARPEMGTKAKRAAAAPRKTAFFSLVADPEQLMAMRLYCRSGGCH